MKICETRIFNFENQKLTLYIYDFFYICNLYIYIYNLYV